MKSLFDPNVFQDIVRRVEALQPSAPRQWGKMTAAQMLEHSARVVEMACGNGKKIGRRGNEGRGNQAEAH